MTESLASATTITTMRPPRLLLLLLLFLPLVISLLLIWPSPGQALSVDVSTSAQARGWGKIFEWAPCVGVHPAKEASLATGKPAMVILHRSACSPCYSLKQTFTKNNELQRLSKNFALINCNSTEEPPGKLYAPDGDYVPRILFFGADGNPHPEIFNRLGKAEYKYYYVDAPSVVEGMLEAAVALRGDHAEL